MRLLDRLQTDGRVAFSDLGDLGLTPQAIGDRVRRLIERGYIRGFSALVDPQQIGLEVLAFVRVAIHDQRPKARTLAAFRANPSVLECHHIAGEGGYLLKVRVPSLGDLEQLIGTSLKLPGVEILNTTLVLSTSKESAKADLSHLRATPSSRQRRSRSGSRAR